MYLRPTSKQYEYARRVASGTPPHCAARELGIKPATAAKWRQRLRTAVSLATTTTTPNGEAIPGIRPAYALCALIATAPFGVQCAVLSYLRDIGKTTNADFAG